MGRRAARRLGQAAEGNLWRVGVRGQLPPGVSGKSFVLPSASRYDRRWGPSRPKGARRGEIAPGCVFWVERSLVIEFLCPNGHRIRCPEAHAGRAAKCPKCGVRFRIPDPAELDLPDTVDSDAEIGSPELTDSGVGGPAAAPRTAPPARGQPPEREPVIEFLCPNGHRLHGPASLQGRPGECPECGARFRIPTYEDIPPEDEAVEQEEIGVGRVGGIVSDSDQRLADSQAPTNLHPRPIVPDKVVHPLAELLDRLWSTEARRAQIELRLASGETLVLDGFAPELSQHDHGVFAVKEADGSFTLTAVAWDAVERVQLRGLRQLPEAMRGR